MRNSQTSPFRIERHIPTPEWETRGRCTVYPFDRMKVGDSFIIGNNKARWKAARAARNYSKRHPDYRFVFRPIPGGRWRCWRV